MNVKHQAKNSLILLIFLGMTVFPYAQPDEGLAIYEENPFYWSYQGEPVLLLGGTDEDNLFQIENLRGHLELLKSVGGNYVRCTMSSRDEGNLKPYLTNEQGLYDLTAFNPAYWNKLESLLAISQELDIIVQVEVWATYDFYWGASAWADNPFNPKLNVNYSPEASGLPDTIAHPAQTDNNPFFQSVPRLNDNEVLLGFQQKFVDHLLSITLGYNNVLYCIDNETLAHYSWAQYWAEYIQEQASDKNKTVYVTEMWDAWDPTNGAVEGARMQHPDMGGWFAEHTNPELHEQANFSYSLNDRDHFQFLDISNHNTQFDQTHYETAIWARRAVEKSGHIRPVNNVKIYGADSTQSWSGPVSEGKERFWRNVFAGHASARFHRPIGGLGLGEEAQKNIKSMRMLTEVVDFFSLAPANELLSERAANEAYCLANARGEYLLYFPSGGDIHLDAPAGSYVMRALTVHNAEWQNPEAIQLPGIIKAPEGRPLAFTIRRTPRVIYDTDFGGDADDLGALAMLHHFQDRGEVDLLAVMCWNTEKYAVRGIDAVNTYYGHPDIPIGLREGEQHEEPWMHARVIAENLPHDATPENVAETTLLYRELLSQSEDSSVVIITVGPLMNIKALIDSEADDYSPLGGLELIHTKVKEFVIMGGNFPSGEQEWNFDGDMPGVTKYVLAHLDLPITFSGAELGVSLKTGVIFNDLPKDTPLYLGFYHFSQHAPWIKHLFEGEIVPNSTYDQTAVLYAVRNGIGEYWHKVSGGFCVADETGGNTWEVRSDSNHSYLVLDKPIEEMEKELEAFMLGEF